MKKGKRKTKKPPMGQAVMILAILLLAVVFGAGMIISYADDWAQEQTYKQIDIDGLGRDIWYDVSAISDLEAQGIAEVYDKGSGDHGRVYPDVISLGNGSYMLILSDVSATANTDVSLVIPIAVSDECDEVVVNVTSSSVLIDGTNYRAIENTTETENYHGVRDSTSGATYDFPGIDSFVPNGGVWSSEGSNGAQINMTFTISDEYYLENEHYVLLTAFSIDNTTLQNGDVVYLNITEYRQANRADWLTLDNLYMYGGLAMILLAVVWTPLVNPTQPRPAGRRSRRTTRRRR